MANQASSIITDPKGLEAYFTDVEYLRDYFQQTVASLTLDRRLLVIHGVGGVGKSSLLRMFHLHCKSVNVPVAFASGGDSKSAFDVLTRWADDLKADKISLTGSSQTFQHYRAIQAKVEAETIKIAGQAVKGAAKTVIETAASTIPGIGPLLGKLSGTSIEALADILLSRGLKKTDIDLLLDPAKKLTNDFLADVENVADKRRLVLMLDTFEQMTALDDWACDVAHRLPPNVLFVIAGRALPNWSRAWDSWQTNAQIEELKPMTEDVMRDLVQHYYATMRGGKPDSNQVEAIIRFARGLPMVVTSAVQLWVKYGVEDFQSVKTEIVANLVDRLMEGVPNALIPVLEAAAVVRWFDQPILRTVTGLADVRDVYNELRRFPFVRVRVEGQALHDAVREIMDENLRAQDSERHQELHERAAVYFEKRLEKATGEEAERLVLEQLYHRICADEETGLQLFQQMAEELTRYRLVNRLRALLSDANTYPLERENSRLWRQYYSAVIIHMSGQRDEAIKSYQMIGENRNIETKLRAYALCNWGTILCDREYLYHTAGFQRAITVLQASLQVHPKLDQKLVLSLERLSSVYTALADWDKAWECIQQGISYLKRQDDKFGLVELQREAKTFFHHQDDWRGAFDTQKEIEQLTRDLPVHSSFKTRALSNYAVIWVWAGRYHEAEKYVEQELSNARDRGDVDLAALLRDSGLAQARQGRFGLANRHFEESLKNAKQQNSKAAEAASLAYWGIGLLWENNLKQAEDALVKSLDMRRQISPNPNEAMAHLGILQELKQNYSAAVNLYEEHLTHRDWGHRWFQCSALTGLVRVKHAQGDYPAIPPLLAEAEQLAQQSEYNDHLASLRLTQGHIAWEDNAPTWGNGLEAALHFYQHALIYALRYNRFLLDEVLSGRRQGTPLQPIIPHCMEYGEEGRQMLIALRDWWRTGVNDIGTPRPDTISPIPEGIPLLDAERIAREREPGDGSPQKSVIEQIEAAFSKSSVTAVDSE